MQFRVIHLLLAMMVVAVIAMWIGSARRFEVNTLIFFGAITGAAGFGWGWLLGKNSENCRVVTLPFVAFFGLNVCAWSLHFWSMWWVKETKLDIEFIPLMDAMVTFDEAFGFNALALAIGVGLLWTAARRDADKLNCIGAFAICFWFLVFANGYFSVSASLRHDGVLP